MRDVLAPRLTKIDDDLKGLKDEAAGTFKTLEETKAKVAEADDVTPELREELQQAIAAHGEKADKITDLENTKSTLIDAMGQRGETMPADVKATERPDARGYVPTVGDRVTDGEAYKALVESGELTSSGALGVKRLGDGLTRRELKALITGVDSGSAGAFVEPDRVGYFPLPFRPLTVLDLITVGDTDSDLVEFVKMLSFTNSAAEVAEAISAAPIAPRDDSTVTAVQGGRKPESGMEFVIESTGVKNIAHWVPATKRSLADAGQVRTIIDGALRWGLDERLETQVVGGNGVGENLRGLLNTTGTNSIGAGPDSHADKVLKATTQTLLDGFTSTGVILNPIDAESIRLSRTEEGGAGTGNYLFGAPNNPGPMTLWGLPVAQSPAMPQGTALVGALRAAILWMREGTQVLASDSHEDFFTRNLVAILAELRAAFGVPTPQALAEVNLAAV